MSRAFLPTWFGLAGIVAMQVAIVVLLSDTPRERAVGWSADALIGLVLSMVVVTGAWAFPKVRAATWLIGAMAWTLLGLVHQQRAPLPPPEEVFGFFVVASIFLAIGAWERARLPV